MTNRKKIILFESNIVLLDTLIFLFESSFNADVLKINSYDDLYFIIKNNEIVETDIAFIFLGLTNNDKDRQKIYDLYLFRNLNNHFPLYDFSDANYKLELRNDHFPIKIPRKVSFYDVIEIIQSNFEIDLSIPKLEYTPITIRNFAYLDNMKHCVYINLNKDKYIKIFNAFDIIELADIEKYEKKGVKFLYLKKDAFNWIYKQIEMQHQNILDGIGVTLNDNDNLLEDKVEVIELEKFNYDDFVKQNKIEIDIKQIESTLDDKENCIKFIKENESNIQLKINELIANIDNNNLYEIKNKILLLLNNSVLKQLEIFNYIIHERLIISTIMHDVIIKDKKDLIYNEVYNKEKIYNEIDQNIDKYHPLLIKNIIEKSDKIPHESIEIIYKHHEKLDGTGFPNKLTYKHLNTLSLIFNFNIELAKILIQNKNNKQKNIDFLENLKKSAKGGISRKVIYAISEIINQKLINQ